MENYKAFFDYGRWTRGIKREDNSQRTIGMHDYCAQIMWVIQLYPTEEQPLIRNTVMDLIGDNSSLHECKIDAKTRENLNKLSSYTNIFQIIQKMFSLQCACTGEPTVDFVFQ